MKNKILKFNSGNAVADCSEAMEADTISKHGRRTSRGKFLIKVCFGLIFVAGLIMGCDKDDSGNSRGKIMITAEFSHFEFNLGGIGVATVDWGDDSEKITWTLPATFAHSYSGRSIRTITINGDNITSFRVGDDEDGHFNSLDVRRCVELRELRCASHASSLTSLDVSKNVALRTLNCGGNQFTAEGLNALFRTLHSNAVDGDKIIHIGGNPGTDSCNRSIAESKGWIVEDWGWW